MREAVIAAAQTDQYSKTAHLCAEGSQTPAVCDVDYWNFGGTPGKSEDCNFLYLRVDNDYWTGLTPMVLNQYTNYLGVTADGKDPANQEAGPHKRQSWNSMANGLATKRVDHRSHHCH